MKHTLNESQTTGAKFLSLSVLFLPSLAFFHLGVGQTSGFLNGFVHPFSGLDHICAMLAVGLWAAQRGGRAIWAVPLTFISVMTLGGILGMAGIALPFVDRGIIISVLILGVLVAASVRMPLVASTIIVGLFALLHGHSHGTEMPQTASALAYGMGFIAATALLHASGIAVALAAPKLGLNRVVRFTGAAIALCGIYLLIA
ncbi:MAG: HupE/UreJ family protein [Bacteroidota bacterium]